MNEYLTNIKHAICTAHGALYPYADLLKSESLDDLYAEDIMEAYYECFNSAACLVIGDSTFDEKPRGIMFIDDSTQLELLSRLFARKILYVFVSDTHTASWHPQTRKEVTGE